MTSTSTSDVAQIEHVLDDFAAALYRKDAPAAVAVFSPDAVAYDLAPPLSVEGRELKDPAGVQKWFDTWSSPIESKSRELTVRVAGDLAYAFGLQHMTGTKKGGQKVDLWFRTTACLERQDGSWRITHAHNSVPFAMDGSDKALLDLKP